MKTLILVRHGKASHSALMSEDFDRKLTDQGRHDASLMAQVVHKYNVNPDIFISSPAARALETAELFAEVFEIPPEKINQNYKIYENDPSTMMKIIESIDNANNIAVIFGHNPTITAIAMHLIETRIEHLPTCGIAGIDFDTEDWKKIKIKKGVLRFFEFPKKYFR
ncbi:MAG: histidine phosphatase family protein [Candidatus Kapabacteria bacterium]|nr:histidine phosphatase family protein [Candidatus Kapabacteria bacterium]